jgi:putative intracellular protease/amidase
MEAKLSGKKMAFLVANGFEQVELTGPREALVDNGLVTNRKPADLPAFTRKMIEEIGEGTHEPKTRSLDARPAMAGGGVD